MTDISSLGQAMSQMVKDQAAGGTASEAASGDDVSRFQSALGQPGPTENPDGEVAAPDVQGVDAAGEVDKGPGHKILDFLGDFKKQGEELAASVAKAGDSPAEMLKVQMQVMQHSAQTELISKTVGSVNKTVESLLKSG